jgi:hypothetical protein
MRSDQQRLWDSVAVLSLFDCVNRTADIGGNLKIQKLCFIYELKGHDRNLKSAHYRFFRYTAGPYSKDLANDVLLLKDLEFVTKNSNQLTDRGRFLLEYLRQDLSGRAVASLQILTEVCTEFGSYSGQDLKERVYDMFVPVIDHGDRLSKVKDIKPFTDILDPLVDQHLEDIELFPEDLVSDIKEEFTIPGAQLDPQNAAVRESVARTLRNIL